MGNEQRRRIAGWAEEDVHTPWRRVYCYLRNHSGAAKVKRASRRRERRDEHAIIEAELHDDLGLPARSLGRNRACKASPTGQHVMREAERKPCELSLDLRGRAEDFVYWECAHGCGKTDFTMEAAL